MMLAVGMKKTLESRAIIAHIHGENSGYRHRPNWIFGNLAIIIWIV